MLNEVLELLNIDGGRQQLAYVDATLGAGGHSEAILKKITATGSDNSGQLIGVDRDCATLTNTTNKLLDNYPSSFTSHHSTFSKLAQLALPPISGGLLADLGVSSMQLDQRQRGFSFKSDAPLDMRMDPHSGHPTAAELLATASEGELADWFYHYAEERHSRPIARAIVEHRKHTPINTTKQLADLVTNIMAKKSNPNQRWRIHPATRVFQGLRIAVNDEFGEIDQLLGKLPQLCAPGARIVIISFHSLEDRRIKVAFRQWKQAKLGNILTKKPLTATDEETATNPRSRSAKLRGFEFT
jgi:16S rRNA (cytosine1402-N4)-methyltransferase